MRISAEGRTITMERALNNSQVKYLEFGENLEKLSHFSIYFSCS
jgi:hypothetical protein